MHGGEELALEGSDGIEGRDRWRRDATRAAQRRLHVCPRCERDRVHPLRWLEGAAQTWELLLRCPDCDWQGGGVFGSDAVVALDAALERGAEAIAGDLRTLAQVNMAHDVERLVRALHAGALLPEDF